MAYIGASGALTNQATASDVFNGNGSNTQFTLSRTVFNTRDIEVVVNNVQQNPFDGSYSVSGSTLTFSGAPTAGANNIYVNYQAGVIGIMSPTDNSVTSNSIANGAVTSAKLALTTLAAGNTTITGSIAISNTSAHTGAATFANTLTVANSGVTFGDATTQTTAASGFGFKNRIINGNFNIAQRATSATGIGISAVNAYYTADRWKSYGYNLSGTFNGVSTQNVTSDHPIRGSNGKCLEVVVTTAANTANNVDFFSIGQKIEGFNIADMYNQPTTLSFWVKTNKTGTYSVQLRANNATSGGNSPVIVKTFTVADTNWNRYTITFPAQSIESLPATANDGISIWFQVASGLTSAYDAPIANAYNQWARYGSDGLAAVGNANLFATVGNYFRLADVQYEVNPTATSFDYRDYGRELMLCQRYYCKSMRQSVVPAVGVSNGSDSVSGGIHTYGTNVGYLSTWIPFPVAMRTTPTLTFYPTSVSSGSLGQWNIYNGSWTVSSSVSGEVITENGFRPNIGGSWSANQMVLFYGAFTAAAEL